MNRKVVVTAFFIAAIVIAGVVSYWASEHPDGLDRSIEDHELQPAEGASAESQEVPAAEEEAASPLADYRVAGVDNDFLANGLAGVIGALLVLGIMLGLGYLLVRRRRRGKPADRIA